MLKIFYILLVVLFAFTLSKSLKKKTKCGHEGASCYHLNPCCTGLTCYNNKCEKRYSKRDPKFFRSK